MPIKGLTDREAQFPQIGTLRKGAPQGDGRPGKDLSYFRFTSDDPEIIARFTKAFGAEPQSIEVYLPYRTTDENFPVNRELWSASRLHHRCDGETCSRWYDEKLGIYRDNPVPCPTQVLPAGDRNRCRPIGRLQVIVPKLERLAYVVVLTSSVHDILALTQALRAYEALRGSLQGMPFILSRRPRSITMPAADGSGRVRVSKHLLSIEVSPAWASVQFAQMGRQVEQLLAYPVEVPSLPSPAALEEVSEPVDEETGELLPESTAAPLLAEPVVARQPAPTPVPQGMTAKIAEYLEIRAALKAEFGFDAPALGNTVTQAQLDGAHDYAKKRLAKERAARKATEVPV